MKIVLSLMFAAVVTGLLALANCYWLRIVLSQKPADLYEVFVYSMIQSGPFVFVSTYAVLHWLPRRGQFSGSDRLYFAISLTALVIALLLNVVFLPRIRY